MNYYYLLQNLDEYFELQLKENLELCKSVLRLTDDRQLTRKKIINLENTITNLTEQLVEAKSVSSRMLVCDGQNMIFLHMVCYH